MRITVNGCDFDVPRNLFGTLIGPRSLKTDRIIWIDALSINQSDTDGRNAQLQLMPLIHKQTECVLVRFGYGTDSMCRIRRERVAAIFNSCLYLY